MARQLGKQVNAVSIAKFSRIGLTEGEISSMEEKFTNILGAFEVVSEIKVLDAVDFQLPRQREHLRMDENLPALGQDLALAGAPASFEGHFRVPPVL